MTKVVKSLASHFIVKSIWRNICPSVGMLWRCLRGYLENCWQERIRTPISWAMEAPLAQVHKRKLSTARLSHAGKCWPKSLTQFVIWKHHPSKYREKYKLINRKYISIFRIIPINEEICNSFKCFYIREHKIL